MENNNSLQLGITAFRSGEKDKARFYFLQAVGEEPNSESAWGWLSNTAVNIDERINCLKQVIRINPQNNSAIKFLQELEANEWEKVAPPIQPIQNPNSVSPSPFTSNQIRQKPWYREIGFLIFCAVFCFPVYVLIVVTDENETNFLKILVVIIQVVLCLLAYFLFYIFPVLTR